MKKLLAMDIDIGLSRIKRRINGSKRVLALDLETLVKDRFLSNEDIVAVSIGTLQGEYEVLLADPSDYNEYDLLKKLDEIIDSYQPEVIIGYNHVSYDITLINTKIVSLSYSKQLFALKYFFGTSYLMDMMYSCALYGRRITGDYKVTSLKNVVRSEMFSSLNLMRVKEIVSLPDMNPAQAVEYLWKNDPESLRKYSKGDVHDLIEIYKFIFN